MKPRLLEDTDFREPDSISSLLSWHSGRSNQDRETKWKPAFFSHVRRPAADERGAPCRAAKKRSAKLRSAKNRSAKNRSAKNRSAKNRSAKNRSAKRGQRKPSTRVSASAKDWSAKADSRFGLVHCDLGACCSGLPPSTPKGTALRIGHAWFCCGSEMSNPPGLGPPLWLG
jgi:hypothetical protein